MTGPEIVSSPSLGFARRHADGFIALAVVLGMAVSGIGGGYRSLDMFCFSVSGLYFRHPWFNPLQAGEIIFWICGAVVSIVIIGWALRLKEHSLWFLGLALVPLGWIVFLFIHDRLRVYRYGFSFKKRQVLCWLGILALGILILVANNWDVPVTRAIPSSNADVENMKWVMVKNFDDAPVIIHLAGQYYYYAILTALLLLYGALLKEITMTPQFRREGRFLVQT